MIKRMLVLLCVSFCLVSVSAGGQTEALASTTTLTVGGIDYPYTGSAMEKFLITSTDVKLNQDWGILRFEDGTIQTVMRSGEGPEVLVVNSGPGRAGLLARNNLIKNLDPIIEGTGIIERYQPWVIEKLKLEGNGHVIELVEGIDVFQFYYNKKIFAELGLEKYLPLKSWDDFIEMSLKIKAAGYLPLALGMLDNFGGGWLGGLVMEAAAGNERMTEVIYGNGSFNTPEFIQGFKMLKQLADLGIIDRQKALALGGSSQIQYIVDEIAAMSALPIAHIMTGQAEGNDMNRFGSFVLPTTEAGRPGRPTSGFAHGWVVASTVPDNKMPAVVKFLDFISSQEYTRNAFNGGATLISPLKEMPADIILHPLLQDARDKLELGAGYNPSVYFPASAVTAWYEALQGVVAGTMTPEVAALRIHHAFEKERAAVK